VFRAFVERLAAERVIAREGSLVRLPEHRVTLQREEQQAMTHIKALLSAAPMTPPDLSQLERTAGIARATLMQIMRLLERERSVVRVGADMYFLSSTVELIARTLREEFSTNDITPAMFRTRFNTTRKYAIPLLEHLDREGVTVRIGDARRLRAPQPSAQRSP
jgi:selenocysteine-specific elongation factor